MDKKKLKKIEKLKKKRKQKKLKRKEESKSKPEISNEEKGNINSDIGNYKNIMEEAEKVKAESAEVMEESIQKILSFSDNDILDRLKVTQEIYNIAKSKKSLDEICRSALTIQVLRILFIVIAKNKSLDLALCYWARDYWETILLNQVKDLSAMDYGLNKIHEIAVNSVNKFKIENLEFINKIINKDFTEKVVQVLFGFRTTEDGSFIQDQSPYPV